MCPISKGSQSDNIPLLICPSIKFDYNFYDELTFILRVPDFKIKQKNCGTIDYLTAHGVNVSAKH